MISNDNENKSASRPLVYHRVSPQTRYRDRPGRKGAAINRSRGRGSTFQNITAMSLPLAFRMSSDLTNSARSRYSTPST